MAKKFKAVFIMEDGEYKEITNEEHQLRKAEDEEYKRKYFIPVDDFLMEVKYQKYKSFYREKEHEKYIKKRDKKKGLILFGELTEVLIAETKENAPQAIESKEYMEYMQKLKELIGLLYKKDRAVINALIFEKLTERQLAKRMGISKPVLHRKKVRILKKLKSLAQLLYDIDENNRNCIVNIC